MISIITTWFNSVFFPKAEKTYTSTQLAHEFGMSTKSFNRKLYMKGIQYYQSGMWLLYSRFRGKGYTKFESFKYTANGNAFEKMYLVWTEKGREFIHDKIDAVTIEL